MGSEGSRGSKGLVPRVRGFSWFTTTGLDLFAPLKRNDLLLREIAAIDTITQTLARLLQFRIGIS
jgi:hypothetical protein